MRWKTTSMLFLFSAEQTKYLDQTMKRPGHIFCGLAYAHRQLGQFEEASIYFEKALNAKGENLGMDHDSVGDLLHEYGVFLMDDWDKLLESAKCFEDALKIWELSHGRDSDKVSDTLFQLSKAYNRI